MLKIRNILENIEILSICIIIFSGSSSLSNYRQPLIALLVILGLVENLIVNKGKISFMANSNSLKICSIIILYMSIFSIFSYSRVASIKYILFFSLMFIYFIFKVKNEKFLNKLIKAIELGSLVIAISILISAVYNNFVQDVTPFLLPKNEASLAMFKSEIRKGAFSGFACERAYAAFGLCVGIVISISRIFTKKEKKKVSILYLGILYGALFCTGKRMLLIVALLSNISIILLNSDKQNIKKFFKLSVILIVILSAICVKFPQMTRVFDRIFNSDVQKDTIEDRSENLWKFCIQMIKEKPVFGYGINSFIDYISVRNPVEIYNAHNIYLQLIAETGVIGFILFIIFFITNLFKTYKVLKIEQKNKNDYMVFYINISLLLQLIFVIYGLTGNPLYYYSQLFVYFTSVYILNYSIINLKGEMLDEKDKNINI